MTKYSTISACRVCKSKKLTKLFSLGNLYISTFVKKKGDNIGKAPLELLYCSKCTLVQLKHTAKQELLYSGNYWYESALNKVIKEDLKDIVSKARKLARPKKGELWIDIGANDGTLLSYVPKSIERIGIEPAKNLQKKLKNHASIVKKQMWEDVDLKINAAVITAIGMFYDSEDPNLFIQNVTKHLAEDGVFIAQMMASKQMLEKNDVGNICHEHIEYYSYKSLKYLYEKNGLEIFKVEENSINGGSYRLYARHYRNGSVDHPETINKKSYMDFYKKIQKNREETLNYLRASKKLGFKTYLYGASTKGNTIAMWYGLNPKLIEGVAEIHPNKIGKYMVGTNIPIYRESNTDKLADTYLVLPYSFKSLFVKKKKAWLKHGGDFAFCTPNFELYAK